MFLLQGLAPLLLLFHGLGELAPPREDQTSPPPTPVHTTRAVKATTVKPRVVKSSPVSNKPAAKTTASAAPTASPASAPSAPARKARRPSAAVSAKARAKALQDVAEKLENSGSDSVQHPGLLVPFFEQLYQRSTTEPGALHIVQFGDSHTAADEWTGDLRTMLQSTFGDAGAGYSLAGRPFLGYRRFDVKGGASKGWHSEGLARAEGDGLWGLGGVSISTALPGQTVYVNTDCQRLELFYLQQPGGGDLVLLDNGLAAARIETNGELGPGYFSLQAAPGEHRFELRTLERAPVRLFGWVTERDKGITYEALGINGAEVAVISRWNEQVMDSNLSRRDPALIVLAYGTNEAGNPNWTQETYRDMFAGVIHRLRKAAPAASILVLGPPDRSYRVRGVWRTMDRVDMIIAAQQEACIAAGCAFWDTRQRMGGKGVMREWVTAGLAQNDHVHFSVAGYHRLAEALFHDIIEQYRSFTALRKELTDEEVGSQVLNGQTNKDP